MNEEDSLEQSLALNKIVLQLLEDRKNETKRLWVALMVSIFLNVVIILGVFWFVDNFDVSTSTITTTNDTSVTQSADSGTNNFFHGDTEYHEGSGN